MWKEITRFLRELDKCVWLILFAAYVSAQMIFAVFKLIKDYYDRF